MSKLLPDGRLGLPTPYKLLQVPGVDFPQRRENVLSPSPSAVDGHSAGDNYSQPLDLLDLDRCDFLVGEVDISLRRVHIVNAYRSDFTLAKKIASLSSLTCVS
jgi:hypothetical protein